MADYIDRDKLIATLEAEKRMRHTAYPRQNMTFRDTLMTIRAFKGEDMVPRSEYERVIRERDAAKEQLKGRSYSFTEKLRSIVFCRDCARCKEKEMFGVKKVLECQKTDHLVHGGDYCSYGVRRENDG